jgi:hypothetical protein
MKTNADWKKAEKNLLFTNSEGLDGNSAESLRKVTMDRAGSTKYSDYPGELTSNPAYKGGVGDCK